MHVKKLACNLMEKDVGEAFIRNLIFNCDFFKSITYSTHGGRCELHRGDKVKNPFSFFKSISTNDYFHRECYDKPSVAILRDDAMSSDTCYETTPGKVLIGIVDQLVKDISSLEECQKSCRNSEKRFEIVCKSAAFYAKEKECIIASQSRQDIPDLFIDDENSVYIENICLTGSASKKTLPKTETSSEPSSEKQGHEVLETMGKVTATQSTLARKTLPQVEQSGYDSSVDESSATTKIMPPAASPKPVPTVNPKIVDTYAVEATPKSSGYGRRLRDERVRTCFSEVRPLMRMTESRVSKAYSLEQCTDICRLCWRCLRGKKCQSVAFDRSKELCALSLSPLIDGGEEESSIIYHNRANC